jgi:hypothetical protein
MELSYLHYLIKLIVRQDRVMRFKTVRFYKIQESHLSEEGTSYNRDIESSNSNYLIPSHTSKCIHHNHSFRKSRDDISFNRGGL